MDCAGHRSLQSPCWALFKGIPFHLSSQLCICEILSSALWHWPQIEQEVDELHRALWEARIEEFLFHRTWNFSKRCWPSAARWDIETVGGHLNICSTFSSCVPSDFSSLTTSCESNPNLYTEKDYRTHRSLKQKQQIKPTRQPGSQASSSTFGSHLMFSLCLQVPGLTTRTFRNCTPQQRPWALDSRATHSTRPVLYLKRYL